MPEQGTDKPLSASYSLIYCHVSLFCGFHFSVQHLCKYESQVLSGVFCHKPKFEYVKRHLKLGIEIYFNRIIRVQTHLCNFAPKSIGVSCEASAFQIWFNSTRLHGHVSSPIKLLSLKPQLGVTCTNFFFSVCPKAGHKDQGYLTFPPLQASVLTADNYGWCVGSGEVISVVQYSSVHRRFMWSSK